MAMAMTARTARVPQLYQVPSTSPRCAPATRGQAATRVPFCFATLSSNITRKSSGKVLAKARGASTLVRATLAAVEESSPPKAELSGLKAELLAAVAGLDRGLVATKDDEEAANSIAVKLEAAGDTIALPEDLDKLQGRWRLVFSSGFNTGSLGGERPGPRITRLPLVSIGLVYQRIDVATRELDNIVDLNLPTPWPLPPVQLTATLAHSFELTGGSKIRIIFDKTIVRPVGNLSSLPPVELPQIQLPDFVRAPRDIRSGEFETTFIDKDLRISRGDRGELRIFVRA